MSIKGWTIVSIGICNKKLRVSLNLNWENLKQNSIRYFEKEFLIIRCTASYDVAENMKGKFFGIRPCVQRLKWEFVWCLYTFYVFIYFLFAIYAILYTNRHWNTHSHNRYMNTYWYCTFKQKFRLIHMEKLYIYKYIYCIYRLDDLNTFQIYFSIQPILN